jgi:micrococcal nuclease
LVQEGYANVDTFPPDVKFADIFKEAAAQAKLAKKGLWAKCK